MVNRYYVDFVEKELTGKMDTSVNYSDAEFYALIDSCIEALGKKTNLSRQEKSEISSMVFNTRRKLGLIQPLLDDPAVNEIMINGTDAIFIEKNGKIELYGERYADSGILFNVIQSMVSWVNRSVNESSPIVDTRLSDGSRVNVVLKPVAINGPVVTIRKFPDRIMTMEDFIENGTLTEEEKIFLIRCVKARVNILVSGGTSSGKTTFLNVLCEYAENDERIITIEDSAELRLVQKNLVRLETKNPNSEGNGGINIRKLIKTALRMRPDRIIVGEVRDEAAVDLLQALCTGHDGSLGTLHSNSAEDAVVRLETMALWDGNMNPEAVRKQIASGLDLIVHLQRTSDMKRRVAEICAVSGFKDGMVQLVTLFKGGKKIIGDGNEHVFEKIRQKELQDKVAL